MFLLCFSLAIRILCLATIFAAPPAPRSSRTRSLAAPGSPGGSARGAYAAYGHWARTPNAGAPATSDRGGLSCRGAARRGERAAGPRSKSPTTGQCSRQPRTSSGSAANVSTGQTPPRGSTDSARSREGGRGRAAASARPFHAPQSEEQELRVRARNPEVNWPRCWRRRKHQLVVIALGETCRGRVRPLLNSHPSAWVSLSGTRWRRPHRC